MADLKSHLTIVARALVGGRVIPFLGAGANLCSRPNGMTWSRGRFLPSGSELAGHLAQLYGYSPDDPADLARVCQYVRVTSGSGPLYSELRQVFDQDYQATPLHDFLAGLPDLLASKSSGQSVHNQVVITTNYDVLLEHAYRQAGLEFDIVTYVADGENAGRFVHRASSGEVCLIDKPNEYRELPIGRRPIIVKAHGAVDRTDAAHDSYVITEDHYISYLAQTDLSALLPVQLAAHLRQSHFLFLGYSLRDWNLRVILHRLWGQRALTWKSWSIQRDSRPIDREFWKERDVDIIDLDLAEYIELLRRALDAHRDANGPSA